MLPKAPSRIVFSLLGCPLPFFSLRTTSPFIHVQITTHNILYRKSHHLFRYPSLPIIDSASENLSQSVLVHMEHVVEIHEMIEYGMNLVEELTEAGWIDFLDNKCTVYAGLIREFWSCECLKGEEIVGCVLKMHVSMSTSSISRAIGCPEEGSVHDNNWDETNVNILLVDAKTGSSLEKAFQMTKPARVLHKILNKAFLQRDVDEEKVTDIQKYCIFNILRKKIKNKNLPKLVFDAFWENLNNTKIFYPVVLTLIMNEQGNNNVYDRMSTWEQARFGPILEREVFGTLELEKMGIPLISNEISRGKGLVDSPVSSKECSDSKDLDAGDTRIFSPKIYGEPSAKRLRIDEGPSS